MPVQCTCPTCGKTFFRKPSYVAKHQPLFCARACHTLSQRPEIELSEDGRTGRIPLQRKDGSIRAYAIVDAADIQWASRYTWGMSSGYAVRRVWKGRRSPSQRFYMHRELLGLIEGDGLKGDHISRNKLDCRRINLRVTDSAGNAQNLPPRTGTSSPYRGVSLIKSTGLWRAHLTVGGKHHHVGHFQDEVEAAQAVLAARLEFMPYAVD